MRQGLTENIERIIDSVSAFECIKPYILCGGTALAIQLGHRLSEDLDFMAWRTSRTEKPEVDWPAISKEIEEKIGPIENMDLFGFDQVIFLVKGVKISFYIPDKYMPQMVPGPYFGNIRIAPESAILTMKLEVMLRRMKFRDYYDVYCMVRDGVDIKEGIESAIKYSQFNLKKKNVVSMLLSGRFYPDSNFSQLNPKYDISEPQMRDYLLRKIQESGMI